MLTIEQMKAARALLGWSQGDLADAAHLSKTGIARIENHESRPNSETSFKIMEAFTKAGIEFIGTEGLRRRQINIARYQGQEEFRKFMDEVYYCARDTKDELCLFNGVPSYIHDACGHDWYAMHAARMKELTKRPRFRIIVRQGERNFIAGGFAEYRWFPHNKFKDKTIYVYGPNIAFLNFDNADVNVLSIQQKDIADSFRIMFDIAWETVAIEET